MIGRAMAKLRDLPIGWGRHRLPDPLPFADSTFDLVVFGLVAEHIEALAAVLGECRRVARPGGRLLLSALHPDRTAQGQRARFIDPETGERRQIATIHRTISEYLEIARDAGWDLLERRSLIVGPDLAASLPRAIPYLGRPLGWAGSWARSAG